MFYITIGLPSNLEANVLSELVWRKPVLTIYRERYPKTETEPFAVLKAKQMTLNQTDEGELLGNIKDFFALMGDIDYVSTQEGSIDKYILCWFDDTEEDTAKDLRRLSGVTFPQKVSYTLNEAGKRTYNATFKAKHGKLK